MSTARERFEDPNKKIKREADAPADRLGRRPGQAGALNTITPCAACKLLRRRCAQECPFSPYFSPHEPHKFASVHKVFGASNVSKMLMVQFKLPTLHEVSEPQRADAANSLVYEANLRLRDPVYGCMGAISALQQQVQALEIELQAVRAEILKHKLRQASGIIMPMSGAMIAPCGEVSVAAPPPPVGRGMQVSQSQVQGQAQVVSDASSGNYGSVTTSHNVSYFG